MAQAMIINPPKNFNRKVKACLRVSFGCSALPDLSVPNFRFDGRSAFPPLNSWWVAVRARQRS